ncbi:ABC transporter substrate-binding protein [Leucobacter denitrificans]|uniref:Extracellular solute-binding protein n=1 Tax=Leucobacter denitrificans TaxID=683042 RepID=A0A7G9S2P4_9MICO|nr:extracellular solute-binding protein [Leucobacter denitrificans]QNN62119.1 extracellular solute-binding protein [Leucobacter denitrificans]
MNTFRITTTLVGVTATAALLLSGCSAGSAEDAHANVSAEENETSEILAMPEIDDSDGLVIDGELVADAELLEAARAGSFIWITSSGSDTAELTAARFEAETGVSIEASRLASTKLNERLLSEAGVDKLSTDVVTIGDPVFAEELANEGVFVAYSGMPSHDVLQGTENVVWSDGAYYTAFNTVSAIAYNSIAVPAESAPTSWADLLEPAWKGKVGVVSAGAGGAAQGQAAFQQDVFGEEYWTGLAAQEPRLFDVTSVAMEALARGEIEAAPAVVNTAYATALQGAPISIVIPTDGVAGAYNMQGLTTKGEDNPAAQLFMNWMLSKSGQKFAQAQGFVSARTDVGQVPTGDIELPLPNDEIFYPYTPEEAKNNSASVVAGWNAAFGITG